MEKSCLKINGFGERYHFKGISIFSISVFPFPFQKKKKKEKNCQNNNKRGVMDF